MIEDYVPPSAPPRLARPAHRAEDISFRGIVWFAAAMAIGIGLTLAFMLGLFGLVEGWAHRGFEQEPSPARGQEVRVPPRPRLLGGLGERYAPEDFTTDPAIQEQLRREGALDFELDRPERLGELYRSVKRRELETYGPAGPSIYRVPIERAKTLLLARTDPLAAVKPGEFPGAARPPAPPVPPDETPPPSPAPPGSRDGRDHPEEWRRFIQYTGPEYGPMRSRAAADTALPPALEGVGFEQRLGARLPADVVLQDEHGRPWRLGEALGHRPIVLAFAYYACPMLCSVALNGMVSSLHTLPLVAGRDYEAIVVSFDPREHGRPDLAAARKAGLVGDGTAAHGWHFLTAERSAIERLTRTAGFSFRWDPATEQFAHAAGLIVATPDGTLSRYLYGVTFPPRDLRLALVEASAGRIGSPVDDLLLYCFRYDPASGRYTAVVMNLVRLAAVALLAVAGAFVLVRRRRTRRPGGEA